MARSINQAGVELVKSFEGCRLSAYRCVAGVWTIGYGSTTNVKPGMTITQAQAEALLKKDLLRFEVGVEVAVDVPLTDNQFAALVSFAFNVGLGALKSSTLLRLLNDRKYIEASMQFDRWNKASGRVLAGLTRRRAAEKKLFLTP